MAPSRALLCHRIAANITAMRCLHPMTRLDLASMCTRTYISPSTAALRHVAPRPSRFPTICRRSYSQASPSAPEAPEYLNEAELHIFNKIKSELEPVKLEVQDISGGCGSMYAIEIESAKFQGLTVIKQHKLVNSVLKEEIAKWHGVQLRTKAA